MKNYLISDILIIIGIFYNKKCSIYDYTEYYKILIFNYQINKGFIIDYNNLEIDCFYFGMDEEFIQNRNEDINFNFIRKVRFIGKTCKLSELLDFSDIIEFN